jgi:GTPase SAR1 family protein
MLNAFQLSDPEIFSKPLVLFLGPWSGGKSSIINYLLGTEFTQNALKTGIRSSPTKNNNALTQFLTGAEPSATFFQILMHGETEEMLDGTQLAADWTFSGLQKFGQAFIDRLRGKRLASKLLEKVRHFQQSH